MAVDEHPGCGAVPAAMPADESARLVDLQSYDILDSLPESAFDDLTRLAAHICGTPISLVSLVDSDRQWFKSRRGLSATETPRDVAFCAHAIHDDELFHIEDTLVDDRFRDNPLVRDEPKIRFYAGAPLKTPTDYRVGTLCVIDRQPRRLNDAQRTMLQALSRQVVALMELRKSAALALKQKEALEERSRRLARSNTDLELANKQLRQFNYIASHDLQEPIRMVSSYMGLLKKKYASSLDEQAQMFIGYASEGATRMQRLVEDLLVYARLGRDSVPKTTVDLNAILGGVQADLGGAISEANARVEVGDLPTLEAAETQMRQLFLNLLGNALKFRRADVSPVVTVSAERTEGEWRFAVADNGIGFESKYCERIFEPFQRLHVRADYEGTGIGLSIVHAIVREHGGTITVTSTPGEGSRFSFSLRDSGAPTLASSPR